jgi:predicted short-subunit dehydrogenase-like oxidoreductase (DUF2520 family)
MREAVTATEFPLTGPSRPFSEPDSNILLIGAGRVGLNLLRLFHRRGMTVSIVVEADTSRHQYVSGIEAHAAVHTVLPASIPSGINIAILAVPDTAILETARQLAALHPFPSRIMVFHCSGTMTSSAIAPLSESGCVTGCIHPMQSFHSDDLEESALVGIGCGIEGGDEFCEKARAFAEALDWRPLRIDARKKALYHAANVFAGNFPIVLASVAERLLAAAAAGDGTVGGGTAGSGTAQLSHLLPMMRTVLARLEDNSPADALTGPAARGDRETIARHLEALEETDPDIRILYETLTREAARLAER